MLFPVFSRAQEAGRRDACLSNMRQIGIGVRMYSEEWGGWTYPEWYPYGNANATQLVATYSKSGNITSRNVWQCPSDSQFGFRAKAPNQPFPVSISYAYNGKSGTKGRNLDQDSMNRMTKGQMGWLVTDQRYAKDLNKAGFTFTGHARVYFDPNGPSSSYIEGLVTIRLMPDLHVRVVQGWQRYPVPRNGVVSPRQPAESYPGDWDWNLP